MVRAMNVVIFCVFPMLLLTGCSNPNDVRVQEAHVMITMSTYEKSANLIITNPLKLHTLMTLMNHLHPTHPINCHDANGVRVELRINGEDQAGDEYWVMDPTCHVVHYSAAGEPPSYTKTYQDDGLIEWIEKQADWSIHSNDYALVDKGNETEIHFIDGGFVTVPLYLHTVKVAHPPGENTYQDVLYAANGKPMDVMSWYKEEMARRGFEIVEDQHNVDGTWQHAYVYRADKRVVVYVRFTDSGRYTRVEIEALKNASP